MLFPVIKTRIIPSLLLVSFLSISLWTQAQEPLVDRTRIQKESFDQQKNYPDADIQECFSGDLGGSLSFGNPDNISMANLSGDNLDIELFGCLAPSEADYHDLFTFVVPEGFELASIHLQDMDALFDNTPVKFRFWFGDDAQPIGSPDVEVDNINNADIPTGNLIGSLTLPLPPGTYTGWIDIDIPFSSTTYLLIFTFDCNDNAPPLFTSEPGSLDLSLECSDEAGLEDALDLEPEGVDVGGTAEAVLVDDGTVPGSCAGEYTLIRTWQLVDKCGNVSMDLFTQTITISDDTPPELDLLNIQVTLFDDGDVALTEAMLVDNASDNCGEVTLVSITPAFVNCDQLDTTIPVTVIVEDECGNQTQGVAQVSVEQDTGIKPPWSNGNIGGTANGSATNEVCDDGFKVSAKGYSVPTSDVAHFVYVDLCGNGEITTRVSGIQPSGGWGGLMIRENMTPGSRKVALKSNLGNQIRRELRGTANTPMQVQQSVIAPGQEHWLRINRTGNTITTYVSVNGQQWTSVGISQVNFPNCVLMGVFAESTNNNITTTVIFDNVAISGGIQPLMAPLNTAEEDFVSRKDVHQQPSTPLKVYPNPTTGAIWVDAVVEAGEPMILRVLDMTGREVITRQYISTGSLEQIDLTGNTPGVYLIQMRTATGILHTGKVVVERH